MRANWPSFTRRRWARWQALCRFPCSPRTLDCERRVASWRRRYAGSPESRANREDLNATFHGRRFASWDRFAALRGLILDGPDALEVLGILGTPATKRAAASAARARANARSRTARGSGEIKRTRCSNFRTANAKARPSRSSLDSRAKVRVRPPSAPVLPDRAVPRASAPMSWRYPDAGRARWRRKRRIRFNLVIGVSARSLSIRIEPRVSAGHREAPAGGTATARRFSGKVRNKSGWEATVQRWAGRWLVRCSAAT